MLRASTSFILAAFATAAMPCPAAATAARPTLTCRVFDAAERRLQNRYQRLSESHESCAVCQRWPSVVAWSSIAWAPTLLTPAEGNLNCDGCGHVRSSISRTADARPLEGVMQPIAMAAE